MTHPTLIQPRRLAQGPADLNKPITPDLYSTRTESPGKEIEGNGGGGEVRGEELTP
jgi:hypothetical protein